MWFSTFADIQCKHAHPQATANPPKTFLTASASHEIRTEQTFLTASPSQILCYLCYLLSCCAVADAPAILLHTPLLHPNTNLRSIPVPAGLLSMGCTTCCSRGVAERNDQAGLLAALLAAFAAACLPLSLFPFLLLMPLCGGG